MLEELKIEILNGKKSLSEGIALALPEFRNKISEHKVQYLVNEFQGYEQIALDYYKRPGKEFPPYRVVAGEMKLMQLEDGELTAVKHPLSKNDVFFISAPIGWLEESIQLGIDPTMVEMAEMGKPPGGLLVCVTAKSHLQRIVDIVKQSLLSFIDEAEMS
jgi:hypothetical protein